MNNRGGWVEIRGADPHAAGNQHLTFESTHAPSHQWFQPTAYQKKCFRSAVLESIVVIKKKKYFCSVVG